ncbi:MAG: hypothetical protein IPF68_15525 [Bacteroidales bacterium]|nr:hypothetical protein [Bacteroidales bacterium]
MSPILIAGVIIVNLALIAYSVAIITEQRKKCKQVYTDISDSRCFLDITATICMIIGSENSFITFHGMIGYLA